MYFQAVSYILFLLLYINSRTSCYSSYSRTPSFLFSTCLSLIFSDSLNAHLAFLNPFYSNPLIQRILPSSSFTPSIHPYSMYPLCGFGFLAILAFRAMSRRTKLSKLHLHFLVTHDHSFSHPIYAHFTDN